MKGVFSKTFNDKILFNKYVFAVEEGTKIAIRGASGIGKTTLLRLIASLEENDCPKDDIENDFKKYRYSFVFQEDRLIESFSAMENIRLCASDAKDQEIEKAMEKVGLENTRQKVKEYSGGMKRRVAILRALFAPYDILLLDEPFKGLDDDNLHKVACVVNELTKGKTVILVSHERRDEELLSITNYVELS
ncbi:MAG: ATP-binding cassette domain-containing protein [Sphaerochaetaceae bacterium]|nr:ATP-binding cassette domain-containing protein [Sphaerochaetaceae bacterium]